MRSKGRSTRFVATSTFFMWRLTTGCPRLLVYFFFLLVGLVLGLTDYSVKVEYPERKVVIPQPERPADATSCADIAATADCEFWAGIDRTGCLYSPGHMAMHCPRTCKMCHLRSAKTRCGPLQNDNAALQPGELDAVFRRLIAEPALVVQPDGSTAPSNDEFVFDGYTIHLLSQPPAPWVIAIDNVLSDEEADHLIAIAHETGFSGSTTTGEVDETGTINRQTDSSRTSTQAWCQGACDAEPLVHTLYSRIAHITTVPPDNYEHLQLLKYEEGQKYSTHHDLLGLDPVVSACGPRILTFFIYLSDVEEGGETNFPMLNMAVTPKKGRAVRPPFHRNPRFRLLFSSSFLPLLSIAPFLLRIGALAQRHQFRPGDTGGRHHARGQARFEREKIRRQLVDPPQGLQICQPLGVLWVREDLG